MNRNSLEEVYESVDTRGGKTWREKLKLFSGPAFLVAVGYMDPGNWATDIAGGSKYGYSLLWVLVMSNLIALLLQTLSARLGIVRRRDLAQVSRDIYPRVVNFSLYLLAEIAIAACDLAEVIGMAIGLNLLFGLPLIWGISLAILDTFLILWLQSKGMRYMEIFILSLVCIIGGAFFIEILFAKPHLGEVASGLLPSIQDAGALYIAIGIIGATVMPHNLYLHSSLVQTRLHNKNTEGVKTALKFNFFDSAIALNLAFFVNAAILILSATVFFKHGFHEIVEIQDAHKMLQPLLGQQLAPILFAVALIASGQSSTITGTLAGQIIMEGYLDLRIAPWLRRLITRLLAVIPAFITVLIAGDNSVGDLLILSQVVLSLQLGFAVIPLIHAVSDRFTMKEFTISLWVKILAWLSAALVIGLNIKLVYEKFLEWHESLTQQPILYYGLVLPLIIGVISLLMMTIFYPIVKRYEPQPTPLPHGIAATLPIINKQIFKRIAICIDFSNSDVKAISAGISQGEIGTQFYLIHVVETAGARIVGKEIMDYETSADSINLKAYAESLRLQGYQVKTQLGFGSPKQVIPKLVKDCHAEMIVMGSHGHQTFKDIIYGETVDTVRHLIKIPILIV